VIFTSLKEGGRTLVSNDMWTSFLKTPYLWRCQQFYDKLIKRYCAYAFIGEMSVWIEASTIRGLHRAARRFNRKILSPVVILTHTESFDTDF
jgi:hypothetical protein